MRNGKHVILFTSVRYGFVDTLEFENDVYYKEGSEIEVHNTRYVFYYNHDHTHAICYSQVSSILYANAMVAETFQYYSRVYSEYKDLRKHVKVNFPPVNGLSPELDEELLNMLDNAYHVVNLARDTHEKSHLIASVLIQEFNEYGKK